ncbi:MmcQ/YjbR family DNA-binding protein [Arthrobacter sp. Marseille-P9274]|uniref:MmcQ/YjbR family DNA-binding protein n=1 Tax=Arthrobacter sp. Marseille-P9274 TaxID=2866572 RepID=UPI0021C5F0A1|nr:MmcQ/YjbR family DNA-binding protein [Arthrobacter sp. Marseille-P9274]
MDGETIQKHAAARTEELPGAYLDHPFGPDWEVFKVRGKVFMLQTRITGEPLVVLKARPADGAALREAYPDITPGYHMNKRHWITLNPGGKFDKQLVEDLVTESYLLVVEQNLPRREQPVDPNTFGQAPHEPETGRT